MAKSTALALYLTASHLSMGPAKRIVHHRLAAEKEHPTRYTERFGHAGHARPDGRLIWFHAASVGEALSILEVINRLLERFEDCSVLVTTVTRTSAEVLAQRLPRRAIHQFAPVDAARAVERFLDHWRPDIALWTESELWPTLIHATRRRRVPMLLVNARISEESARRYRWLGAFSRSLLGRFDGILAQDDRVAARFYRLGADRERIRVAGSLKEDAPALPFDSGALATLSKALKGRPVWLAASTHEGEEAAIATAHAHARRMSHRLALVIAPRHPERGDAVTALMRQHAWIVHQRSAGEALSKDTDVYVADTVGEMGLWYRLAAVSLVAGSMVEVGGHNPIEPAQLGSAILHGPHVANFQPIYDRLAAAGGAVVIPTPGELGVGLVDALRPDRAASLAAAAWRVVSESSEVAERVVNVIAAHLPPPVASSRLPRPVDAERASETPSGADEGRADRSSVERSKTEQSGAA